MDLFRNLEEQGAMITRLASDSRRAGPGVAFFAYPGEAADGRAYIADAVRRGAAAVVWEEEGFAWRPEWQLPNAPVRGLKQRCGALASEFYGRPSESLWICGVTGTNGKTSCSQWIAACLDGAVIGTLGYGTPGALQPLGNTTPDALELHYLLKTLRERQFRAVSMEVSSHGLVQGRVSSIAFDCALFTNVSHDHLDYHGSMEAYVEAKARLFDHPGLEVAVLNLDDVVGVQLARKLTARGMRTIGYSLSRAGFAPGSVREHLFADNGQVESSWGRAALEVNQLGRFNVSNALGVLGCLVAYGMPFEAAAARLAALPSVPGRMEVVSRRDDASQPLVVVDYAHTPDALDKVLQALRPVADARRGRLIAVFGAGGDRDAKKRPLMGTIVARMADHAVVTSDNPRGEDPSSIIAQITRDMQGPHEAQVDRARAIELAIGAAAPADVVLIAGKGHEDYQEIAGKRLPFSDAHAARAALAKRAGR